VTLATNIKAARASKKLTQKQLAELAGISHQYVKELETGIKKPKIALYELAKVLGVSVEYLMDGKLKQ
jgi:transcriptional regulator with XRE-family HTH domain